MSRASSALCISCGSVIGRRLENKESCILLLGSPCGMGGFRRDDDELDHDKRRWFAGFGRSAVIRRFSEGYCAGWVEWGAERCANSGRCDEGAREQTIQRREGCGEEWSGDSDGHG